MKTIQLTTVFIYISLFIGCIAVKENNLTKNRIERNYYNTGIIKKEIKYQNQKLNGISKWYYDNGKLESQATYKEGIKNGLFKWYYKNQVLKSEELYKDGIMIKKVVYNKDGTKKSEVVYRK